MKPMQGMKPMEPMKLLDSGGPLWPSDLGEPAAAGSQNDMRYAFFPEKHRLLIEIGGKRTTYDSGDHRIDGISQQSGDARSVAFSAQDGPVRLQDLKVVD